MILVAVILACTACVSIPPKFAVTDCKKLWVLSQRDPKDCVGDKVEYRRSLATHCTVTNTVRGCKVGALRFSNAKYANPTADWDKSPYVYARLYDWECPPGVTPPEAWEFTFISTFMAPMACDENTPQSRDPLLPVKESAAPGLPMSAKDEGP
jgi:hypothetical protein